MLLGHNLVTGPALGLSVIALSRNKHSSLDMAWSLGLCTFLSNEPWTFQPTKGRHRLSNQRLYFCKREESQEMWHGRKRLWAAVGNRDAKWWLQVGSPVLNICSPFTLVEWHIKHLPLTLPQRGAHGFRKLDYGLWHWGDCHWSLADACWLLRVGSPKCVWRSYRGK